jgi:hypothetical protein
MESAMKIGDVVQVLDDNLEGVILRIQSDNSIVIETKDGFVFLDYLNTTWLNIILY